MLNFLKTRRLFAAGLTISTSLFCSILFLSLSGIILPDGGKSILWIIVPLIITCVVTSILFVFWKRKLYTALIAAASGFFITFVLKGLLEAKFPMLNIPTGKATAVITGGFILATVIYCYTAGRSFRFIASILIDDADTHNRTDLLQHLRSMAWNYPENMKTDRTLSSLFISGSVALLLAVTSSLRHKDGGTVLSVLCTALFFSGLFIFLITKQMISVARYLLAERQISKDILKHWNSAIIMILAATCAVTLVLPHSFSFYDESVLRDFINRILAFFSINPYHPARYAPEDIILPPIMPDTRPFHIPGKLFISIVALITLHALCALAGLFFLKVFRSRITTGYAQFCIRKYRTWVNIALNTIEIIRFLLRLITFPFRIFFTPKLDADDEEYSSAIAVSFVRNFHELPDEKKAEIRTIVDSFMKLTRSAGRKGFLYHYSMGPSEYIDSIRHLALSLNDQLSESASIINESRYSPRILSKEKIDGFTAKIDVIIKTIDGEKNEVQ